MNRKTYGITDPISLEGPREIDIKLTQDLEAYLRDENRYESNEEGRKREEVLGTLNAFVKEWVKNISLKRV